MAMKIYLQYMLPNRIHDMHMACVYIKRLITSVANDTILSHIVFCVLAICVFGSVYDVCVHG